MDRGHGGVRLSVSLFCRCKALRRRKALHIHTDSSKRTCIGNVVRSYASNVHAATERSFVKRAAELRSYGHPGVDMMLRRPMDDYFGGVRLAMPFKTCTLAGGS